MDKFCGSTCPYLDPSEYVQNRNKTTEPHYCKKHNVNVVHGGHHPKILKCKDCIIEALKNELKERAELYIIAGRESIGFERKNEELLKQMADYIISADITNAAIKKLCEKIDVGPDNYYYRWFEEIHKELTERVKNGEASSFL